MINNTKKNETPARAQPGSPWHAMTRMGPGPGPTQAGTVTSGSTPARGGGRARATWTTIFESDHDRD